MKNELRMIDFTALDMEDFKNNIEKYQDKFEMISFGSESCYRQLPSLDKLEKMFAVTSNFKRKLLLPMTFESFYDDILKYVDWAIEKKIEYLCVNDYGILNYIYTKYGALKDTQIVIGNGLSYSIEYVPWHEHFFEQDPEFVKENMLKNNFDNQWTFDFLKKNFEGMKFEIEMASTSMAISSIETLTSNQMKVHLIADLIPVSYTRCCHTAKYYKRTPKDCGRPCRELLVTERTHRWMNDKREVVEIPPEVRKIIPKLLVWGNATYSMSNMDVAKKYRDDIQYVIWDYRFYKDLETLVKSIEEFER